MGSRSSMSEQAFLVLTALVEKPLHGYAIMREIADISDGRVRPRVGTLYAVLDRMAGEGLVQVDREDVVDGRFRRYYQLTDSGQRVVAREAARQAANARAAELRLARWRGGSAAAAEGGRL